MSVTFSSLPVEIQRACVNYLDIAALQSMRLTSQATNSIATEALFQVATLQPTEEGTKRFLRLIGRDRLRCHVRKLRFYSGHSRDDRYEDQGYSIPGLPSWWKELSASDITLPNLKELILDFTSAYEDGYDYEDPPSLFATDLKVALMFLIVASNVDTLTVRKVQDVFVDRLPAGVRKLNLELETRSDDACSEDEIDILPCHALFNKRLNEHWLAPMQSQLTHLTLHCNTYWGVYPRWLPEGLHFPQLKSLAFSKWTIAFDWQIDFITSHGQTLEQLILSNSPILHALRMTYRQFDNKWDAPRRGGTIRGLPPLRTTFSDLRWHTVLGEFRTKLTRLKYFSMGRDPANELDNEDDDDDAFETRYKLPARIDSSRYAIFDFIRGPAEWFDGVPGSIVRKRGFWWTDWLERETDCETRKKIEYPDCFQEDQEALEGLLRALRDDGK